MKDIKPLVIEPISIQDDWIKLKYPDQNICFVQLTDPEQVEIVNELVLNNSLTKEQMFNYSIYGYMVVIFPNKQDALDFCNKLPDSDVYCAVYRKGICIHENT
jgi:hypothetical protein